MTVGAGVVAPPLPRHARRAGDPLAELLRLARAEGAHTLRADDGVPQHVAAVLDGVFRRCAVHP